MTLAADVTARSDDERPFRPAASDPPSSSAAAAHGPAFDYAAPGLEHLADSPTRRLILPGPGEGRATRAGWWLVAGVVAALYFALLMTYWAPAHPGVDQNGYLVGGRQFSRTLSSGLKPESDFGFVGRMWIRTTDDAAGVYYPKYPLGLPIYYAANLWLGDRLGFDGHVTAQLLSPIGATLAILGVFALVRRISGGFMGVMAMLLASLGQVMLTLSINPNSHAAGTGAVVCGVACLIGWLERGTLWRGVLAGLCFGIAYTIRYTEGLMLLPLGVAMLYAARWAIPSARRTAFTVGATVAFVAFAWIVARFLGDRMLEQMAWLSPLYEKGGRPYLMLVALLAAASLVWLFIPWRTLWRLLAVAGAWLAPVVYLTLFNMIAMRSFTSYAGTNESTGFGYDYFVGNWEKMVRVLADQGLFFIAPLGLLGLLLMFRRLPLVALILALWFFPSVLLYTAYYWAPDNFGVSYSRFVLTQLPALVVSAAWLIGEAAGLRQTANRTGWMRPSLPAGLGAAAVAIAAVALAAWASARIDPATNQLAWRFDPRRDPAWWAIAVPAAIVAIVAAGRLLANVGLAAHFRERFEQQVGGALPRVAVGAIVFVSCALGSWRAAEGVEWGQRANARASVELQSRENLNLAALGNALRDATARDAAGKRAEPPPVPDEKILLFADGERLHHLQWIGNWDTFDANAFTPEAGKRYAPKPAFDANDPDPIDPNTCAFMRGVYANKDEKTLVAEQNKLMSEALARGKRIFYVLNRPAANVFERRYVNGRGFEARSLATFCEMPSPRRPEEFLPPEEQPKQPVGRSFIRGNIPARFTTPERQTFRIVEIVAKAPDAPPKPPTVEEQMAARRAEAIAATQKAVAPPPPAKAAVAAKPATSPTAEQRLAAVRPAATPKAPTTAPTAEQRMAARRAEVAATTPKAPTTAPTAEQRMTARRTEVASTQTVATRPATLSVDQRMAVRRAERAATQGASTTRPTATALDERMAARRAERSAATPTAPSAEQRLVVRRDEAAPTTAPVAARSVDAVAIPPKSAAPTTAPAVAQPLADRRTEIASTQNAVTPTPKAAEPATPTTAPTTRP